MGGTSFLLNKKFHPARLDNQKKVFIAEQKSQEKKNREEEAAKEILKEKEVAYYENLGEIQSRDPRQSSLKFMYSAPISSNVKSTSSNSNRSTNPGLKVNNNSSSTDPAVALFWAKINEKKTNNVQSIDNAEESNTSESIRENSTDLPSDKGIPGRYIKRDPRDNPLLKNAPREGSYVSNMSSALYKPFSEKLRNVQCSLCGEWGHRFGDRECSLREYNPHDYARLQREDPMTYFKDKLPEDKQAMVLSEALGKNSSVKKSNEITNDPYDSDPEVEFLNTLTPREKMLLLRKLRVLQGESVSPLPSSSDEDTGDDDSSSSDDSSHDDNNNKKRKKSSKHKKNKHKHRSHKKKRLS